MARRAPRARRMHRLRALRMPQPLIGAGPPRVASFRDFRPPARESISAAVLATLSWRPPAARSCTLAMASGAWGTW